VYTLSVLHGRNRRSVANTVFFVGALAAASLGLFSVVSTRIEQVPLGNLAFLGLMPITFWAGYVILFFLTAFGCLSRNTNRIQVISLILLWALFLFVAPELMEVDVRNPDVREHLLGLVYLSSGRFSEFYYSPWPGYFLFVAVIQNIIGVNIQTLPKFLSILFDLVRPLMAFTLFCSVLRDRRSVLLACLTFLGLLCMPGTHPTTYTYAIIESMPLFAIVFDKRIRSSGKPILVIVLVGSIVVTHPLISLVTTLSIVLLCITSRFLGSKIQSISLPERRQWNYIALVAGISWFSWMCFSSSWVFGAGWQTFLSFVTSFKWDVAMSPISSHLTTERHFVVNFTLVFFGVLSSWFLATLASRRFWRKPRAEKLFPLLFLIPISVAFITGAYTEEVFQRSYLLATPFIAWFLIRGSKDNRKMVMPFLLLVLALSFPLRYASEAVSVQASTSFAGARFVVQRNSWGLGSTYYTSWLPHLSGMTATLPDNIFIYTFLDLGPEQPRPELQGEGYRFAVTIDSQFSRNQVLFYYGRDIFEYYARRFDLFGEQCDKVYSNGDFTVYAR
jgi:hypothetical protein